MSIRNDNRARNSKGGPMVEVTPQRPLRIAAALLALALTAACGSGGDASSASSDGKGGSEKLVTVHVASTPSVAVAPIYLGIKKGIFKAEGLNVVPTPLENATAISAAVNGGSVQFGEISTDSFLLAASNGVPLKAVAGGGDQPAPASTNSHDDTNVVLVPPKSDIKSAKDLEGKTVAVNQLHALFQLTIEATMQRAGADPSKVNFVVMSFSQSLQALMAGRIDAAAEVEPFVTQGLQGGAKIAVNLFPFDSSQQTNWVTGVYVVSSKYAEKHPGVVESFRKAMATAESYAEAHPDEVRDTVPSYSKVDPAMAKVMILQHWRHPELTSDDLKSLARVMVDRKFIQKMPDVDALQFKT